MITKNKHIIAVVGMARSGTSAITRGLQSLGISLGNKLAPPRKLWNPKGSMEDDDIVYKVNRGINITINFTWKNIYDIQDQCLNNPKLIGLKKYAKELLIERFIENDYWAFKDPRTAKLLPFWQDIFKELQLIDHYILAIRNPLASAMSYHRVSGIDLEEGMLMWMTHNIVAIDCLMNKNCVVVNYDAMMQQSRKELMRIKNQLHLPDSKNESALIEYEKEFLDKKLQHFVYSTDELKNHPLVKFAPCSIAIYELLMRASSDQIELSSKSFLDEWTAIRKELSKSDTIYQYIDHLIERNKAQERIIRYIHRSLPWKITYPLRRIDDILRSFRHKRRIAKKTAKNYA